ncbi:hypothetical protein ACUOA8_56580, partial [Escherichia sp. SS-MK2]
VVIKYRYARIVQHFNDYSTFQEKQWKQILVIMSKTPETYSTMIFTKKCDSDQFVYTLSFE